MSLLADSSLEEYARQCTLKRRRYEECLHQAQRSDSRRDMEQAGALAQTAEQREFVEDHATDRCDDQNSRSCVADLLEISVDPLGWNDRDSVIDETRNAIAQEHQWQNNRSQRPYQSVTNSIGKSTHHVSYGAP